MVRYRFWDNSSERKLTSLDPVTTVAYKVGQYGQYVQEKLHERRSTE